MNSGTLGTLVFTIEPSLLCEIREANSSPSNAGHAPELFNSPPKATASFVIEANSQKSTRCGQKIDFEWPKTLQVAPKPQLRLAVSVTNESERADAGLLATRRGTKS
jgi:hypothetical protein